jgi:hypothetical protein
MLGMPPRKEKNEESVVLTTPPPMPETPAPKRSGMLTDDESNIIMTAELTKAHRKDERVIAFIESFVRCKNVSQAAHDAGVPYYKGYNWRQKSDISQCIQKLIDKSAVKYGFDATEVMERTKEIMDFDPIQLQNADGTFKSNLHDIAPEARRNLKKLKVKNIWGDTEDKNGIKTKIIIGEVIEYEFYDKMKAIDLAGKEKDMFKTTTRVEHDVTKDMKSILLASLERGSKASLGIAGPEKKIIEVESTPIDEE